MTLVADIRSFRQYWWVPGNQLRAECLLPKVFDVEVATRHSGRRPCLLCKCTWNYVDCWTGPGVKSGVLKAAGVLA